MERKKKGWSSCVVKEGFGVGLWKVIMKGWHFLHNWERAKSEVLEG